MTISLLNIRMMIAKEVGEVDSDSVILWANQVNADIGVSINLPATATIEINTTAIEYPEPPNLKIINRLSLQSDIDAGYDKEYMGKYRRYNGKIIFPAKFNQADSLIVDYYKQLTYFTDVKQNIDLEDRYAPLYASYGVMKYYKLPSVMARLGEPQARQEAQVAQGMYMSMKQQVQSLYALASEPVVIRETW